MPTFFVIMGFGEKTDLSTGRRLNLDKTYKNIIKPAVTDARYDCIRADEIQHSGVIDVPMYEMLYAADLVIADLSTSNLNAVFELGVRHALKPRATIIIAEDQFNIPFDASHILVNHYQHLGLDIGFDETMRMRKKLADLARALMNNNRVDSPVYTVLPDLDKPSRRGPGGITTPGGNAPPGGAHGGPAEAPPPAADTYAGKLESARRAINSDWFALAQKILDDIYVEQTAPGADGKPKRARPGVVQQLALATYKAGEESAKVMGPDAALRGYAKAEKLLRGLDMEATTDPQTLGLWSAIHKRRAQMSGRSESEREQDLDRAIRAAERGFIINRDYYTGTNLAFLLNLRASMASGDDRIADSALANRVRREVVDITARRLATLRRVSGAAGSATALSSTVTPKDEFAFEARPLEEEKFWVEATHADALYALGDLKAEKLLKETIANAPAPWMGRVAQEQHDKPKTLGIPSL